MKRLWGNLVIASHLRGQRRAPFLPESRIAELRDRRIRRLVAYAARTVPYYRELFSREGIDPREIRGARELDALPLLERNTVRRDPDRFRSESRRAKGSLGFLTSGSSGSPLEVHHDRRSVLANIAFGERERAPVIALAGGSFRPREVHIGYPTSNLRKVLAFYAEHTLIPRPQRQSLSMVAPFEETLAAINRSRPEVLTAYGGFLDAFFRTLVARGAEIHPPKVVIYVGETLPADCRRWIEEELGARVMSRYCAAEAFKIGYFCEERTGFHLHDDLCHVRIVDREGRDQGPGEAGEVVVSNLVNHGTVLLGYRMGDVAALAPDPCPCGRSHRLLSELQGRVEDVLPLPGGEHLHPRAIWAALKDHRSVLQYQLVQQQLDRFELKLRLDQEGSFTQVRDAALDALRPLLGPGAAIAVTLHPMLGEEERRLTGKFRAVISLRSPPGAPPHANAGATPGADCGG